MVTVYKIGPMTNAVSKRMPGMKNLRGIESLVK
jgi:hypothetical protein